MRDEVGLFINKNKGNISWNPFVNYSRDIINIRELGVTEETGLRTQRVIREVNHY